MVRHLQSDQTPHVKGSSLGDVQCPRGVTPHPDRKADTYPNRWPLCVYHGSLRGGSKIRLVTSEKFHFVTWDESPARLPEAGAPAGLLAGSVDKTGCWCSLERRERVSSWVGAAGVTRERWTGECTDGHAGSGVVRPPG